MNENNQSQGQTQNTPTKKPWHKKWWVIVIGVVVFIGIIGNSGEEKSKQSSQQPVQQGESKDTETTQPKNDQPAAEPENITPQVTVTSATLLKEYSENEVAADEKYKEKVIEVSGKVVSVDNGTFDNGMIVKLSDGQYDFNGTMCYMKEGEKDKVLKLKKGVSVTLIGKGNSATLKSPVLKDCIVK